ncbi:MAG: ribokinase [Candidatus Aminicenantes bacterium]|nr:ribokinase [Candidatus Aminicenantes bacterium]
MDQDNVIIVPGGMNTDLIGLGVERILAPGELTLGGSFRVSPGGKARNMAEMAAAFLGKNRVSMIGRTSRDPFGFWEIPLRALEQAGVNTQYVRVQDFEESGCKFPGMALIPVDKNGRNQIYVLPGVNADFSPEDVDAAENLFSHSDKNKILILALEIPKKTAAYCIAKAARHKIRVILDPGGISEPLDEFLSKDIFLLTPNEHEMKILTGIELKDFGSAAKASRILLKKGVQNVLITLGPRGAYFFNEIISLQLPCPKLRNSGIHDETGCGDQVNAVIAASIAEGKSLVDGISLAVLAGTLQFYKAGIQPVTKDELLKHIKK